MDLQRSHGAPAGQGYDKHHKRLFVRCRDRGATSKALMAMRMENISATLWNSR
jgi:hypothetical protein